MVRLKSVEEERGEERGVRREGWEERSGERGGVGEGEMERWKMRKRE